MVLRGAAREPDLGGRFGHWVTRLFVLVLFGVLSVGMTWPLVLNLRKAVPGPPWDNMVWLYDLWWFRHSIVDLSTWPTINPTIFAPFGYDLALSETMYANKLLIAPVLFWADEVVAYNTLVLLTFVLTGYGTYLFVAYLTDNRAAGVVAGAILAFCPYRMHCLAAGWLPLLSTQWIPLALLSLERMITEERPRFALGAGVFLAFTFLSSWYYVYIVGGMIVFYLAVRLAPWKSSLSLGLTWRNLAIVGVVTALPVIPVALPVLMHRAGSMTWSLAEVEKWAASIDDFILPGLYHPVWGERVLALRTHNLRYPWYAPGFVSLGFVPLVLGLKGFVSSESPARRALFWAGAASLVLALGLVLRASGEVVQLSVGPRLADLFARGMSTLMSKLALHKASLYDVHLEAGKAFVPLPALLVYLFFPLGNALRTYYRFGLITSVSVAAMAGLGAASYTGGQTSADSGAPLRGAYDIVNGRARSGPSLGNLVVTVCLLGLVLAEFAVAPLGFGFSDVRPQPLDRFISSLPEDAVVMQFPLSRALSGDSLYRTKYHERAAAYGHGTFYPQGYWYAMPILGSFPDERSLRLLASWGVTHVVVAAGAYDAGWGDQEGQTWASVEATLATQARSDAGPSLRPVGALQDQRIWRDERVTAIMTGYPPVRALFEDKLYVYELR